MRRPGRLWRTWLGSPLTPAVVIAVCYIVFFILLLKTRNGDVSLFVIAGGENVNASKVPAGLTVIPNIGGYDGIWFYRLAIDPFTRVQTAHGIRIDNPAEAKSYGRLRCLSPAAALSRWVLPQMADVRYRAF